jgi:hypothetical protein
VIIIIFHAIPFHATTPAAAIANNPDTLTFPTASLVEFELLPPPVVPLLPPPTCEPDDPLPPLAGLVTMYPDELIALLEIVFPF